MGLLNHICSNHTLVWVESHQSNNAHSVASYVLSYYLSISQTCAYALLIVKFIAIIAVGFMPNDDHVSSYIVTMVYRTINIIIKLPEARYLITNQNTAS